MDEKWQKQVKGVAGKSAEAIGESYQAVVSRSASAREFFNGVIENLKMRAEYNRALAGNLIEQQRKQGEASQAVVQELVNVYMDFLNSVFFYLYRGSLDRVGDTMKKQREKRRESLERAGSDSPVFFVGVS